MDPARPLLITPHNDDETLFTAFTILHEHPNVVIVFDSHLQQQRGHDITWQQRREESRRALAILGVDDPLFLGFSDLQPNWPAIRSVLSTLVYSGPIYIPAWEGGGHQQHNDLSAMCDDVWRSGTTHYMTYTSKGKSEGVPVSFKPAWVLLKLKALASYESQILNRVGCVEHFLRSQMEYYQP